MIFDKIENLHMYAAVLPGLDIAARDIAKRDFAQEHQYPVHLEGGVFFSVAQVQLKSKDQVRWECHDDYADLQYVISGDAETIEYAARGGLEYWQRGNGDIFFSDEDKAALPLLLEPGYFAIFLPQDAHRPALGKAGGVSVKAVYKIPVE